MTEEYIRSWFIEVEQLLEDDIQILNNPIRIFNMDETSFYVHSMHGLILAEKGKPVYCVAESKKNLTILITASHSGEIVAPFALFSYEKIPKHVTEARPKE